MKYTKRGTYKDLNEYTIALTGGDIGSLDKDIDTMLPISGIREAAGFIRRFSNEGKPVYFYGDYDCDGIGVSYIAYRIMQKLGTPFKTIIPRRMSDGYGLNVNAVSKMPDGCLLVLGDNGITAFDAIDLAKKKGITVVILDHHLSGDRIPNADIIVDPEAFPEQCPKFQGYCGAGLFYRLFKELFPYDDDSDVIAAAGTSTIADSVPLISENRYIVKRALNAYNTGTAGKGYLALANMFGKLPYLTSKDIGFSIAPSINAWGRLEDAGSLRTAYALLVGNDMEGQCYIREMFDKNKERKALTEKLITETDYNRSEKINFVMAPSGYGGLYGLMAGRIAGESGKPAFVMAEHDGIVSGSARSDNGDNNNVKKMLDSASDLMIRYGGHAPAAGFSFKTEDTEKVHKRLLSCNVNPPKPVCQYDLLIKPEDVPAVMEDLDKMEPFGEGFPAPVFRMDVNNIDPVFFGKDVNFEKHLRVRLNTVDLVGFFMADRFKEEGCPDSVSFYGTLSWNYFNGNKKADLQIIDFERN